MSSPDLNFLEEREPLAPPPRPRRPIFFILIIIAVLLLGFVSARAFFGEESPSDPAAYDPITLEPIAPRGFLQKIKKLVLQKEIDLAGAKDDRINVLMLGQGGPGHDGPYLTDTILIVSIKPSTREVAMISIPRDLAVSIPGKGVQKINYANAFGESKDPGFGPALTAKVLHDTFDLDIHYYIRVDFKAFSEIIDAVGGVNINVERSFVDTEYPAAGELYQTISFREGNQLMNSDTALKYARSRHGNNGEGSDFARAYRQQKILLALKEKVLSFETLSNPAKINTVLSSLEQHIVTNLEFADIISMLKMAKETKFDKIVTLTLDNGVDGYLQNGTSPDGAFILEPKTGDFLQISAVIKNIFSLPEKKIIVDTPLPPTTTATEPPPTTYDAANIEIQNGTWQAGLAARLQKDLVEKKFTISTIGNTVERPVSQSVIYRVNHSPEFDKTVQEIKKELGITLVKDITKDVEKADTTDILVIIGENFTPDEP